jgi:hypothetical protein
MKISATRETKMATSPPGAQFMRQPCGDRIALCQWLTASAPTLLPTKNTNWDNLIHTAAEAGILPFLYTIATKIPLGDELPKDIANVLSTVYTLNTDRNHTALAQVQELAFALNRVGIQPVVLKGLANILAGVYPDVGVRYLADIDLLVSPDEFPAAIAAFRKLGYATSPAHPVEFNIGHSYPPLTRSNSLEVDLHRTMGLGVCVSFLPASEAISHSTVHYFGGAAIRIPSPEHLLTHHIMHSQMHDHYRERVNPSLRTLYDFLLLERHFRGALDWHAIEDRFCDQDEYATFALYLLQVESSLGLKPPIALRVSSALRIRRRRRELLQQYPRLRFFDPCYYFLAGALPRTRRLREILAQPGGWHYLLQKFSRSNFYVRLRHDFR